MSRLSRSRLLAIAALALAGCVPFPEPNPDRLPPAPPPSASTAGGPVLASGAIHKVQAGETVYLLAERYRVPLRNIIDLNRLQPPYRLVPGQPLFIPKPREHRVAAGETVYGISRRYGVDMSALMKLNGIVPPYTIKVGQALRLPAPVETEGTAVAAAPQPPPPQSPPPGAAPPPGPDPLTHSPAPLEPGGKTGVQAEELPPTGTSAASTPTPPASAAPVPSSGPLPPTPPAVGAAPPAAVPSLKPATSVAGIVPAPAPRASSRFLWPVDGKILSSFGPKKGGLHNDGINIAAARGAPVRAAENGVVAYAGNELRGFGNLLLIKHADGWTSAYAHNEELLVRRGDRVARGQVIAKVGSTGNVTSPQLHFELRKGTGAVDPAQFLTRAQAGL